MAADPSCWPELNFQQNLFQDTVADCYSRVLEVLLGHPELRGLVAAALVVVVHGREARVAEGGAVEEAAAAAVLAVALQALQRRQLPADYALPRG